MPETIRLAIVEDDLPTREAVIALLAGDARFVSVGAYGSGEQALTNLATAQPEIMLADINLPGMSGIDFVRRAKALQPQLQVLMLTTYEDGDRIFRSLRAGASGYLLKRCIAQDLLAAIHELRTGGAPMSMPVARKVVAHFQQPAVANSGLERLSAREREILELLATGCLYKEIGDKLGISFSTVRAHLRKIYEKLHVQSRTEATVRFLQGND
jgi:DNA-binding NarL/FixJ family response regulator